MTTVTVDLTDLERLVMTTGALKTVEQAMHQRRHDPFVREHLNFTEAHDRLATAMRNAQRSKSRGDRVVDFDGPLEADEEIALKVIADYPPPGWFREISTQEKIGEYLESGKLSVYDRLAAKGMCVIGQLCEGAVFAGEPAAQIRPVTRGFAVKITDRGRAKLAEIEAAPVNPAEHMTEEKLLRGLEDLVPR
jgi:hypothetical protein